MRVLDEVWMLVSEQDVIYRCGAGITKEDLKRRGFRAKKVSIVEME